MNALTLFKKAIWRPVFKAKSKISNWYVHTYIIPGYDEKRHIIREYKNQYATDVFIETGTFLGDTVEAMKNEFAKIYSIELSAELAAKAQARFNEDQHVKIIQGNSGSILKPLLQEINAPCLFWLDGHYSSQVFINGAFVATATGAKKTPVMEELEAIFTSSQAGRHIILIDDARLFNGKYDYPTIGELENMINAFNVKFEVSVQRDIIRMVPPGLK